MATNLIEQRTSPAPEAITATWLMADKKVFECRALICPEPDGCFSAHALRLPGVVSEGETVDEAISNLADAFREAIQIYLSEPGGAIPWADSGVERTKGCQERWILVNA